MPVTIAYSLAYPTISIAQKNDRGSAPPGGRVDLLIEKQQRNSTMKQRLSAFGAVGTVLTALILSLPAMAGESVPFKGRSGGVVTNLGFDPVRNIVYLHQAGKGHATHLGSFTVEGDVEVDVTTGGGRVTLVLTVANGDVVLMRGDDGHSTGPTTGAATFRIVGGTGRFQGATGLIQWTGTTAIAPPTLEPNPYTEVFEGTISFTEK